jgi:tetratricopeptide (TPR) repeat protein
VSVVVLLVVLLVGFALRVAFLVENRDAPEFRAPTLDALYHDHLARVLVGLEAPLPEGVIDPLVETTAFQRPPAYPMVLGLLYRVIGDHWLVPRVLSMLLSMLLAALLLAMLARGGVRPAAALVTGILVVTTPSLVFFEGELMPEAPLALLMLVLVFVAERAVALVRRRDAALLGFASGLLTITRPNLALPALAVALVVVWLVRERVPLRRQGAHAILFVALFALPIAPVAIRNAVVAHVFVPVSQNGATTLLYGNNARADGVHMNLPDDPLFAGIGEVSPFTSERFRTALEATTGRELSASDVDALLVDQAARFVREDPARFITLTLEKALLFFGPARIGNNREIAVAIDESLVLRFLPHTSVVFFPLLLLGALALFRRRHDASSRARLMLSLAAVGGLFFSVVFFVAAERFRLPLTGVLALLAGHAVDEEMQLYRARDERGLRPLVARTALLAALVVVASIPFVPVPTDRARFLYERSRAFARLGDTVRADQVLDACIALDPDSVDAQREKGFRRLRAGDARTAVFAFDRALARSPSDQGALLGRGTARMQQGDAVGARGDLDQVLRYAPDDETALYNRALARFAIGDSGGAARDLQHLLTLAPLHHDARNNLGRALLQGGDLEGALGAFEAVLSSAPAHDEAAFNRTKALTALGRRGDAARALDDIIASHPQSVRALMNRGALLLDDGELVPAIALFERALAVEPENAFLAMNLARAQVLANDATRALIALDRVEQSVARGRPGPPKPARTELRIRALLLDPSEQNLAVVVTLATRLVDETREEPFALALLAHVEERAGRDEDARRTQERLRLACARARATGDPACVARGE